MRNSSISLVLLGLGLGACATSGTLHQPLAGGIVHGYTQGKLGDHANVYWFETPSGPVWVDVPISMSETKRLRSEMVRPYRAYITAAEPERFGGLPLLRVDEVPVVTTPAVASEIRDHGDARLAAPHARDQKEIPSHIDAPTAAVEERTHDMVGEVEVELLPLGPACSEASLALYLPHSSELITGDVVFGYEHPDLTWGRSVVWQDRLNELKNLEAKHVYPGHGVAGGPELIDLMLDYLKFFHDQVAEKVKPGAAAKLMDGEVKAIKQKLILRYPKLKNPERIDRGIIAEYAVQLAALPPPPPPPPPAPAPTATPPAPAVGATPAKPGATPAAKPGTAAKPGAPTSATTPAATSTPAATGTTPAAKSDKAATDAKSDSKSDKSTDSKSGSKKGAKKKKEAAAVTGAKEPRREIGWQEFGDLCQKLALEMDQRPFDAVVGIARGGSIVGATLSFMVGREYFPIRLAKRGGVTRVIVPPTKELAGRSVALIDDLSRTGETFRIALHELSRVGVASAFTVALVRREPGFRPDISATTASAADKIAFPWGREVLVSGKFQLRKL